jgi:putative zinc finger protein
MSELPVSPECETVQPELNAYVDGELSPAECEVIGHHLASCAACQSEAALLRLVTQSLRQAPRPVPSEAMRQRLLAQVIAELPLRRIEIMCTVRHGDRVIQRREVRMYREPPLSPRLQRVAEPPLGPIIQQFRRVLADRPTCYQAIESYYGRENHERRA